VFSLCFDDGYEHLYVSWDERLPKMATVDEECKRLNAVASPGWSPGYFVQAEFVE
jgi:hypothetical protein